MFGRLLHRQFLLVSWRYSALFLLLKLLFILTNQDLKKETNKNKIDKSKEDIILTNKEEDLVKDIKKLQEKCKD